MESYLVNRESTKSGTFFYPFENGLLRYFGNLKQSMLKNNNSSNVQWDIFKQLEKFDPEKSDTHDQPNRAGTKYDPTLVNHSSSNKY